MRGATNITSTRLVGHKLPDGSLAPAGSVLPTSEKTYIYRTAINNSLNNKEVEVGTNSTSGPNNYTNLELEPNSKYVFSQVHL